MVKAARCSPSSPFSSQQRSSSCPPLASLSLASTNLKPSGKATPFLSFLKRASFANTVNNLPESMDPLPSPPPSPLHSSSEGHLVSIRQGLNNVTSPEELSIPTPTPRGLVGAGRYCKSQIADSQLSSAEDAGSEKEMQDLVCGRLRLQQHRIEMSGKVIIPDTWGREQQLQEWVSYGIVEDALRPAGLMSARTALVNECQHRGNKPGRTSPAMSVDVEVS